jgi:hypothetical protein
MFTRRPMLEVTGALAAWPLTFLAQAQRPEPRLGDDGLYVEPWFSQSFFDLNDDLAEAASSGRHLVIIWQQRGCRELHQVSHPDSETATYIQENFVTLQLNRYRSRQPSMMRSWGIAGWQLAGTSISRQRFISSLQPSLRFKVRAVPTPRSGGSRSTGSPFISTFIDANRRGYHMPDMPLVLSGKLREE